MEYTHIYIYIYTNLFSKFVDWPMYMRICSLIYGLEWKGFVGQFFSCAVNTLFFCCSTLIVAILARYIGSSSPEQKASSLVSLSSSRAWVADPIAGRDNRDHRNWNRDDRPSPHDPYDVRTPGADISE